MLSAAILENTFSLADLYERVNIMQHFLEQYFFDATPKQGLRIDLLRALYHENDLETLAHVNAISAWGPEILETYTTSNMYDRIRDLKFAAESCPRIVLDVPVVFTTPLIERIGRWCRANVHPAIMLELRVRPEAVGGCIFSYNNVLHDVSLSYFAKKERAELLKVIHSYA